VAKGGLWVCLFGLVGVYFDSNLHLG